MRMLSTPGIGGGAALTGNSSERALEFSRGFNRVVIPDEAPARIGVIDSRVRVATAQFVAAGSFGLLHATMNDWLTRAKADVLNKAFDLRTRCLPELMRGPTRERDALRLAAASHAYSFIGRTASDTDQQAWATRWSKIFAKYNPGPTYRTIGSINGVSAAAVNGTPAIRSSRASCRGRAPPRPGLRCGG
jgi:hypothetical protein